MTSDILVTNYKDFPVVATYVDNELQHLSVLHGSDLGDVYLCKVTNVVKNINGAFVKYGSDKAGYVSFKSILPSNVVNRSFNSDDTIRQGDEIILQVEAEEQKLKKAKLSCQIAISGRYTVITLAKKGIGVSKKLPDDVRGVLLSEIKESYKNLCDNYGDKLFGETFGVIVRTEAAELPSESRASEVIKDMEKTLGLVADILKLGKTRTVYSCIYRNNGNDPESHILKAKNFLKARGITEHRVINESVVYSINNDIDKLTKSRVWLKSGAFLIIEQLESFNAIDVNTGKAISGKKNIIKKVNEEAAVEIMRQIRLRNLTGMILIDFINMKDSTDTEQLCNYMRSLCRKEPVHTEFIDITGLGIVELTRSKNDKSLKEILQNNKKSVDTFENA